MPTDTTIVKPTVPLFDEARLAIAGFLARYSGATRTSYATDLRQFFAWCAQCDLEAFAAKRGHIELYARTMEERGLSRATIGRRLPTVAGFYRFAVIDGAIEPSPAEYVRRPKIDTESAPWASTEWSWAPSSHGAPPAASSTRPWPACWDCSGWESRGAAHRHRAPRNPARPPHRHCPGQGLQAGGHPAAAPGGPCRRPRCRGAGQRSTAAGTQRRATEPSGGDPHRRPTGQAGRREQAHLAALAPAQLHHRCLGRRGASPGCPDRRPARRPPHYNPVRPGTEQPRPSRQLHRHGIHRRGVVGNHRASRTWLSQIGATPHRHALVGTIYLRTFSSWG